MKENTVNSVERDGILGTILGPVDQANLYLEIGQANSPYIANSSRGTDVRYLGIDGGRSRYHNPDNNGWCEEGSEWAPRFTQWAQESIQEHPNAYIVTGDAQALSLKDYDEKADRPAVRETFMRDVLLLPGVHDESIEKIFTEQTRVLCKDGLVIIRETEESELLDGYSISSRAVPYLRLLACMQLTGFVRRLLVRKNDPHFKELLTCFPGGEGRDGAKRKPEGFYLIGQQATSQKVNN